jgi:hypothetical protein
MASIYFGLARLLPRTVPADCQQPRETSETGCDSGFTASFGII